jgi:hypothetical protein
VPSHLSSVTLAALQSSQASAPKHNRERGTLKLVDEGCQRGRPDVKTSEWESHPPAYHKAALGHELGEVAEREVATTIDS